MAEAHIRSDEGIARGPRKRIKPYRRDPETGQVQAIPSGLDPNEVLDKYLTEKTTSQIAKEYGVTRKSLVAWLRKTVPEQWKIVQAARAVCLKEDGQEGIMDSRDGLSLARARALVASGQWDCERLDSEMYGQKQEVKIDIDLKVQVDHALTSEANELLNRVRGSVAGTAPKAIAAQSGPEKVINPTSTQDN